MRFDTEIIDLARKGLTVEDIMTATGKSRATVYRSIKAYNEMLQSQKDNGEATKSQEISLTEATDIDKIDAKWVLKRLVNISTGIDVGAGPTQITALKAILDMLRAKETMPAEMSLAEKIAWLKRAMTPDEFIQVSEGWAVEDRKKVYDSLASEFQSRPENPHKCVDSLHSDDASISGKIDNDDKSCK